MGADEDVRAPVAVYVTAAGHHGAKAIARPITIQPGQKPADKRVVGVDIDAACPLLAIDRPPRGADDQLWAPVVIEVAGAVQGSAEPHVRLVALALRDRDAVLAREEGD